MGFDKISLYVGVEITCKEYEIAVWGFCDNDQGMLPIDLICDCEVRLNGSAADDDTTSQPDADDATDCRINIELSVDYSNIDYDSVGRLVIGIKLGTVEANRFDPQHLPVINFEQISQAQLKFNTGLAMLVASQPKLHALLKAQTSGIVMTYH